MNIIKTIDNFKISEVDLVESGNKNGLTIEECKLLQAAVKATFFDDINEYKKEEQGFLSWITTSFPELELIKILETINGRIVVLYG